jgi:2-oxoglutarate ferredoxin oxidoreductase subunit gamma
VQAEVIVTGIGGQGVQLCAKALAMAAVAEGREVLLSSSYGGEMRGGQTEASVVVADAGLRSLPILPSTWSALAMHPKFLGPVAARLRPGGLAVVNTDLVGSEGTDGLDAASLGLPAGTTVVGVAAGTVAESVEAPMGAGFVLLAAYAATTGMVTVASLVDAMKVLVPPYRAQHVAANERALAAGAAAVTPGAVPVWGDVAAGAPA